MPTLAERFDEAARLFQGRNLAAAEAIARAMLADDPRYADAWHLLGMIAHDVGQGQAALDCARYAVTLQPTAARYHNQLGIVLGTSGQPDEAAASFEEALRLVPELADAH